MRTKTRHRAISENNIKMLVVLCFTPSVTRSCFYLGHLTNKIYGASLKH